jgi:hypothetical protein
MNFRRGMLRLFVALTIAWYLLGAVILYGDWTSHYSKQKANLDPCLDAVRNPSRYTGYEDEHGHPIARATYPTLSVHPITDTEESCRKTWVVTPIEEYEATAFVILFPLMVYGFGKALAWIGKGFREGPSVSN